MRKWASEHVGADGAWLLTEVLPPGRSALGHWAGSLGFGGLLSAHVFSGKAHLRVRRDDGLYWVSLLSDTEISGGASTQKFSLERSDHQELLWGRWTEAVGRSGWYEQRVGWLDLTYEPPVLTGAGGSKQGRPASGPRPERLAIRGYRYFEGTRPTFTRYLRVEGAR